MESKTLSKEMIFISALVLDSIAMTLLTMSDFGISTMSSLPWVLSVIFNKFSFGIVNFLVQSILLLILIAITKQPKITYIFSFMIGLLFGLLVDLFSEALKILPTEFGYRVIYFIVGWLLMALTASLFIRTTYPLMPFDGFVADLSAFTNKPVKTVKTGVDISFIMITLIISYIKLNKIVGVGVGTICMALMTGSLEQWYLKSIDRKYFFVSRTALGAWVEKINKYKRHK